MGGYNLPDDVTEADIDRHFGGEDPRPCDECGKHELVGGEECPGCGEIQRTEAERDEDARDAAMEAKFDALHERGEI